ncbi:ATP-binding protein [Hymenobacter sp. BT635]|uniref:ATP-binding protein n=1 Tax=Hymenobacter nitidus TaxID=2880929 RepID=A0ABS8AJ18_9BACT|nr:ATP-binding protein [Hymenobacter nitidus]MCB2380441.1 ATP-binding protein [Hymenobacter nitidus]
MSETIGIRPDVGVLSVLRYLNYKPWYALAEYVDNSIDSYLKNKEALLKAEALLKPNGPGYKLKIDITIDASSRVIRVVDNAAGISAADLGRALRMAEAPPDKTKLSEFGMGMKAASCWFAPVWAVQTKALGEAVARSVTFDVASIVKNRTQELQVKVLEKPVETHYTIVNLAQVFQSQNKTTIARIKAHLASIYREYIRSGEVIIQLNGETLEHEHPVILTAPLHSDDKGTPVLWRHEVDFPVGEGRSVRGFAAIRETGSTSKAGFALFRRGRVIEGSTEEGYRPEQIFGRGNSFRSQRLFGELHLDGFGVSHTKDGFQWDGYEEEFLAHLQKALSDPKMPILAQAEKYRKNEAKPIIAPPVGPPHVSPPVGPPYVSQPPIGPPIGPPPGKPPVEKSASESVAKVVRLVFNSISWQVHVKLSIEHAHTEWMEVGDYLLPPGAKAAPGERLLGVRVALSHGFGQKMQSPSTGHSALISLAVGLAISQALANDGGATNTSILLDHLGEVLSLPNLSL